MAESSRGTSGTSATKRLLGDVAHARSGDKGADSNVGVYAHTREDYERLKRVLTPERVARHFGRIAHGAVRRYELDNLLALNFILGDSLGGGGSESLKTDAQGKTHGLALLRMELDEPATAPRSKPAREADR